MSPTPASETLKKQTATMTPQRLRLVPAPDTATPEPMSVRVLYRMYAPYVAGIAHDVLGRGDEVDDVIQEVFMIAHRGIHALREPSAIKGWLAAVTVRRARRKLRWQKLRRMFWYGREEDHADALPSTGPSPEQQTLLMQTNHLLARLPAPERICWTMFYLEEHSVDEIATIVGCSYATVKRRLSSARSIMGRLFDDQ